MPPPPPRAIEALAAAPTPGVSTNAAPCRQRRPHDNLHAACGRIRRPAIVRYRGEDVPSIALPPSFSSPGAPASSALTVRAAADGWSQGHGHRRPFHRVAPEHRALIGREGFHLRETRAQQTRAESTHSQADTVIHLRQQSACSSSWRRPASHHRDQVGGTGWCWKTALRYGAKVLIASTLRLWEGVKIPSVKRRVLLGNTPEPRAYAASKMIDGSRSGYHREHGLKVVCFRRSKGWAAADRSLRMVIPRLSAPDSPGRSIQIYGMALRVDVSA